MVMTVGVPVCIIVLNDIFQHYFWTKVEGGVDKVKVALHSGNVEMGYVALKKKTLTETTCNINIIQCNSRHNIVGIHRMTFCTYSNPAHIRA